MLSEHRRELYSIPDSGERALSHHLRIYEAIESGDPAGAREAMHAHLDQVASDFAALEHRERPSDDR